MTREQKIEWLKQADTEALLRQYEVSSRNAFNAFELASKDSRYTLEGIFEDFELVKAEVVKRMTR